MAPSFSRSGNQIASEAASPEPFQDSRALAFWRSIASVKEAWSTPMPRDFSASWVRSSGKP
ncbi:hypothetical protein ACVWZ3_005265 [Bradyrhizobium sp. i1.3.6]